MASLNDDAQDLLIARDAPPDEKNRILASMLSKIVGSHLRRPATAGDEVSRVLIIISHIAKYQAGAFGWGEPSAVGPTILGLIEQLAYPSEERQHAVLSALENVMQLLRMGSARALSCLAKETVALLRSLSSTSIADASDRRATLRGFEAFANLCAVPPAAALAIPTRYGRGQRHASPS